MKGLQQLFAIASQWKVNQIMLMYWYLESSDVKNNISVIFLNSSSLPEK